jgi:hypothetical protein
VFARKIRDERGNCPDVKCPLYGWVVIPFPMPGDWHALMYHYPTGKEVK